ncbi:MAG: hypothetical protein AUJ85_04340 [Elusimicrobia bacterium CG1_02_37_114]|nr:MAG: hypothetical protein AUJ85_04340 [Elusimicrobia bacterium CG1_02_37_114]
MIGRVRADLLHMKISKPKILLGIPIALLSLEAYIGILFGYFFANFFSKILPSFSFNIKNYRLHVHHWFMGTIAVMLTIFLNLSPLIRPISLGFFGGVIFQGISSYPDWHKILIRVK